MIFMIIILHKREIKIAYQPLGLVSINFYLTVFSLSTL